MTGIVGLTPSMCRTRWGLKLCLHFPQARCLALEQPSALVWLPSLECRAQEPTSSRTLLVWLPVGCALLTPRGIVDY